MCVYYILGFSDSEFNGYRDKSTSTRLSTRTKQSKNGKCSIVEHKNTI